MSSITKIEQSGKLYKVTYDYAQNTPVFMTEAEYAVALFKDKLEHVYHADSQSLSEFDSMITGITIESRQEGYENGYDDGSDDDDDY
jgi:hypothetical protein